MQDVPLPDAKTGYVALGSYPDGYGTAAQEAGCPPYCEARDSFVRFYARVKPPDDIRVQVTLLGNAGGAVVARSGGGEAACGWTRLWPSPAQQQTARLWATA